MPIIRFDNPIDTKSLSTRRSACALALTGSLAAVAAAGATAAPASAQLTDLPAFASQHAAAPAVVSSPNVLMSGATGAGVKQLQGALHIPVNGVFGSATVNAVERFQRSHHLQADGVVGPQTRNALHLRVKVSGSSTTGSSATATGSGSGGYTIPASIVMCESGGNYRAVNSSTGAGGAYQILPSTWAAYGGKGLPEDASPAEQGAIAAKIYASAGPGQWVC